MTTAIIGMGKIGSGLARNLMRGGEHVVLAALDHSQAEALAEELGDLATAARTGLPEPSAGQFTNGMFVSLPGGSQRENAVNPALSTGMPHRGQSAAYPFRAGLASSLPCPHITIPAPPRKGSRRHPGDIDDKPHRDKGSAPSARRTPSGLSDNRLE